MLQIYSDIWLTKNKLFFNLVLFNILHCKVEPNSKSWIACIWSDKKVIFVLCNVVHSSEVTLKYVEISNLSLIYLFRNNFFT